MSICFMNAFANPAHERAAAELVREALPDAYPHRLDRPAAVDPLLRARQHDRAQCLRRADARPLSRPASSRGSTDAGFGGALLIMQSNGGVMTPASRARRRGAHVALGTGRRSAPPGLFDARAHGQDRCITVDMGGTSFEAVGRGRRRRPTINEGTIARHRDRAADARHPHHRRRRRLDRLARPGRAAAHGPASAGADAGPGVLRPRRRSCRPRPTPTSCSAISTPTTSPAARMKLDAAAARRAIEEHIARPLGLDASRTPPPACIAWPATNMAQGVREVTIKRGYDPREFPMIAAGGAGPIHSCLDLQRARDPAADRAARVVGAVRLRHAALGPAARLRAHVRRAARVARLGAARRRGRGRWLPKAAACSPTSASPRRQRRFDVRLDLPLHQAVPRGVGPDRRASCSRAATRRASARAFHAEHNRLYGYSLETERTPVELINVRVQAIGVTRKAALPDGATGRARTRRARSRVGAAFTSRRRTRSRTVPVLRRRTGSRYGNRIAGPAMIEDGDHRRCSSSESYDCAVDAVRLVRAVPEGARRPGQTAHRGALWHEHEDRSDPAVGARAHASRSITDEMSTSMEQTTRSPILCEAKDYVTGLYDADGGMLEQTENLPILAFSLAPVCKHIMQLLRRRHRTPATSSSTTTCSASATRTTTSRCTSRCSTTGELVAWTAVQGPSGRYRRRRAPAATTRTPPRSGRRRCASRRSRSTRGASCAATSGT